MKNTRIVAASLFLLAGTCASEATYYVATNGSDANPCTQSQPCATFQRGVDLCPSGGYCGIQVGPGVYSQKTNVIFFKSIAIIGDCSNRSNIVVDDRVNGTPVGGYIFTVQDHAVLTVECLTIAGYAAGSVGFAARQFAVGDLNSVNFVSAPQMSLGVAANETSKVNVNSPGIYGNVSRWATVADNSQLSVGGNVVIGSPTFDVAFVSVLFGSIFSFYPTSVSGSTATYSYQCADGIIKSNVAIPGNGQAYPGSTACRFY